MARRPLRISFVCMGRGRAGWRRLLGAVGCVAGQGCQLTSLAGSPGGLSMPAVHASAPRARAGDHWP